MNSNGGRTIPLLANHRLDKVGLDQVIQKKIVEPQKSKNKSDELADLKEEVIDLRQDLRLMVRWFEEADRQVQSHFHSWSWRIGFETIKLGKRILGKDHPAFDTFQLNELFHKFRTWKSNHSLFASGNAQESQRQSARITFLAGAGAKRTLDLCAELARELEVDRESQVINFSFTKRKTPIHLFEGSSSKVIWLPGSKFPRFHRSLVEALARVDTSLLIVADCGLTGLGLGLLMNYHYGTPLALLADAKVSTPRKSGGLSHPLSVEWNSILQRIGQDLPRFTQEEVLAKSKEKSNCTVLYSARAFAEEYSDFYSRSGEQP